MRTAAAISPPYIGLVLVTWARSPATLEILSPSKTRACRNLHFKHSYSRAQLVFLSLMNYWWRRKDRETIEKVLVVICSWAHELDNPPFINNTTRDDEGVQKYTCKLRSHADLQSLRSGDSGNHMTRGRLLLRWFSTHFHRAKPEAPPGHACLAVSPTIVQFQNIPLSILDAHRSFPFSRPPIVCKTRNHRIRIITHQVLS